MKLTIYVVLWVNIAVVAAIDTYFNIRYPVTTCTELNPVASAILSASNNDYALLIALKFVGTAIVLALLVIAYFLNKRIAYPVITALACFQLFVLYVLLIA